MAKVAANNAAQLLAAKARERLAAMPVDIDPDAELADDPVPWAKRELGVVCWPKQAELVRAVPHHESVACRSGHKVGKSMSAALIALWWTQRYSDGQVVLTAPTAHQVKHILWAEIRKVLRRGRLAVPSQPLDPALGIQWPDGRYIRGLSTKDPEAFAGISGPRVLYIVDEASGVDDPIFEAIEGNLAGGAHVVMLGNPTQPTGQFQRAFHAEREFWHCLHISSEDSPNVAAGERIIPGLATGGWVDTRARKWGHDSPLYQVRVAGNFATTSRDTVIGLGRISDAVALYEPELLDESTERLHLGVDVARFGDDSSAIAARRGSVVGELVVLSGYDTEEVTAAIVQLARKLRRRGEAKPVVKVDVIGVGLAVAKLLTTQHRDELDVVLVTVSEASSEPDEYADLRSELWFRLDDWLAAGGVIPDDPELQAELIAPRYGFDKRGRRMVEGKDTLKKRLRRSPDRAEAVALAVHQAMPGLLRHRRRSRNRDSDGKPVARPVLRFGGQRGF